MSGAEWVALPTAGIGASPFGFCTRRAAGGSDRARPARRRRRVVQTPTGRRAGQPHTARLAPGRRELFADERVWEELERWGATAALVRFSGGGGDQGGIAAVTLEDANKRELARWGSGEGELPEALAAADLGSIRAVPRPPPHQRAADVGRARAARSLSRESAPVKGSREPLSAPGTPTGRRSRPWRPPRATRRTHRSPGGPRHRAAGVQEATLVPRCGEPLPAGLRAEARYCSKRCRQAASRARVKDRPPSPPPGPAQACMWCGGPMPGWPASGGTILLQAVPRRRPPGAPSGSVSTPRTPCQRDTSNPRDAKAWGSADAVGARDGGRRDQSADQGPLLMG